MFSSLGLVFLAFAVLLASETIGVVLHPPNGGLLNSREQTYETFQSVAQPDVGLRLIRNSGVCETTPGVNQLSGYIDFGNNMSMVKSSIVIASNY